jgi:hypothetical protein
MLELFKDNPWLVVVTLALLIPILGVVFGTITRHLTTVRLAELDAGLKQDMLQRGMSAEEIKLVIEATPRRKGKSCGPEAAALREFA